jgi:hypothetical protein
MARYRNLALTLSAGIAVVVVLVLVSRPGHTDAGQAPVTSAPAWTTFAAEVTGVRKVDDRTVMVQVSLPAGRADCARDPHVEMLQDQLPDRPDNIYANVVFSSAGASEVGACPEHQPAEVELRVTQPLGERALVLNTDTTHVWAPAGDTYRLCDPTLGCRPPADHCDPVWIDQAVLQMDVPVKRIRSIRDVLACDGTWLVFDLNRAAGQCPPAEGAPKCEITERATRLFMHFDANGWVTVAGTQDGGCAAVHAARPAFPAAMCEKLPPTH